MQVVHPQLTRRSHLALLRAVQLSGRGVGEGGAKDRREDSSKAALLPRAKSHQALTALSQVAQQAESILTSVRVCDELHDVALIKDGADLFMDSL